MLWLVLLAGAGLLGFEVVQHRHLATAEQKQTLTRISAGKAYALVVSSSAPNSLDVLRALTRSTTSGATSPAWGSAGSPFVNTGSIPSPGASGNLLVPVLYLNVLAANSPTGEFVMPFHLPDPLLGDIVIHGAIPL